MPANEVAFEDFADGAKLVHAGSVELIVREIALVDVLAVRRCECSLAAANALHPLALLHTVI
jgi:hypothetical protein